MKLVQLQPLRSPHSDDSKLPVQVSDVVAPVAIICVRGK